jgi:hypothetical protein
MAHSLLLGHKPDDKNRNGTFWNQATGLAEKNQDRSWAGK